MSSYKESNWYVLQVFDSQEDKIKDLCLDKISRDILSYAFVPKNERLVRHRRKWEKTENILFPGYVFLETDRIRDLYIEMSKINAFKVFVAKDDEFIHPIYEYEKMAILKYVDESYIARLSKGLKDGDEVIITEGPLVNNEGNIKSINRKKRKAYVEIELLGQLVEMELGLEIISKKEDTEEV